MTKTYSRVVTILLLICLVSCSEDDSLTALSIEANPDTVELAQNSEIDIFIFENDLNIPTNGQLSVSNPSKGTVEIVDTGNSPDDPSDDLIRYEAFPNHTGSDFFDYTICSNTQNCKTARVTLAITSSSTVVFDLEAMPYTNLSQYNFFTGDLKNLQPGFGVVPYTLNSTLFSDYAKKKRFLWMPDNTKATYVSDDLPLDFPTGTIMIKNFYYDNVLPDNQTQLLETRLMIKKVQGWTFANYIWNDEQTDAHFSNDGSYVSLSWLEGEAVKATNYRIPSRAECFTCHNQSDNPVPIGPKPQNLNRNYDYSNGINNQLREMVQIGYLDPDLPATITSTVAWDDNTADLNQRVRSYLDINCAHCHSDEGHCNYRPMRFAFSSTSDANNIGVCVEPETQFIANSYIVKPNDTDLSILFYRLNTTDESFRMPLLGRTINHDEGVELIEEWINSLTNCD